MTYSAQRGVPPRILIWAAILSLGVATVLAFAAQAYAEDQPVFVATAPENTSTVWIDIEGMELSPTKISVKYRTAGVWHDANLRNTTFGVSAIIEATSGPFEVSVASTEPANPDVALTFVSGESKILSALSKRVVPSPANQPTTPVPSATTPVPSETTPVPSETTPVPSATTPVPSETTPAPGNGNGNGQGNNQDAPGHVGSDSSAATNSAGAVVVQETETKTAPTATGNLSNTGFAPVWLFAGCAVLLTGLALLVLARRQKGAHA